MKNTLYQSCNSGDIQKKSKTYNFPIKINIFKTIIITARMKRIFIGEKKKEQKSRTT